MKKTLLLLLAPFLISCYEQQRNCADFKTGKFRFEYESNGEKKTTEFERRDSIEIETFQGKTDTATIRWVNDCEYVLRKMNPKNMQERKAVAIKILTTSKNSYTFEFGLVGSDARQKGTATKLN
ncbi:MAG TPA: DNA topoisomerase IV [Flavobacterium sp.]|jgi:hypothetical protein